MIVKKISKISLKKAIFGSFFAIFSIFGLLFPISNVAPVMAEPEPEVVNVDEGEQEETENEELKDGEETKKEPEQKSQPGETCETSLGPLGWLACPSTGKIAEAVDWLYGKIGDILVINPVSMDDDSPVYNIWRYFLGVTNIVFVIFLLVVVYSQLTGLGISNYGIKKTLPKLIVVAILVNLSFLVCSILVDLSNILGSSLRGVFTAIEESTISSATLTREAQVSLRLSMAEMYGAMADGASIATISGLVGFETGAIWMLIPVALGAIVAVATGLATIAMRQAVVMLLIMVAPLAIVAYILPNTEQWFKKWKDLLFKMLVFYPMFSLLFGASSLAGWAIISAAKDGFGIILGVAVQIFPLFFSWSLMKMSGTILGKVNAKMQGIVATPLARNRAWAESRREATKQRYLASANAYTPTLRLRQYLSNRRIAREEETKEFSEVVKNRGLSYTANRNYRKNGTPSRDGERAYEMQMRNMRYQRDILRHKNNMNKGLGQLEVVNQNATVAQKARLAALDSLTVKEADLLKAEQARTEKIDYENAVGYHKRMEDAINSYEDSKHLGQSTYKRHNIQNREISEKRFNDMLNIMEGDIRDVHYIGAHAAYNYDTQAKIVMSKFQKYFELTPPTRDLRYRIEDIYNFKPGKDGIIRASDNIDTIISGLRVLNQRGDTDFVRDILNDLLDKRNGGVELGTHASQALASFLMFDVKDNDPFLRRFGKYINLETARAYDKNERKVKEVTYDEYIKGYHDGEPDLISKDNPTGRMYAKKDMVKLMEGTSLDGVERTAFDSYDESLREAYTDEKGNLDLKAYEEKRRQVDTAMAPQFISANMKYLSGSEQIVSAVKSKTGFFAKQDPTTGEYTMVPIWDDEKQAKKLFSGFEEGSSERDEAKTGLKAWYRKQTLKYLEDQTPAQILGLRSDYYVPLVEHLSDAYLYDKDGNEIPERMAQRNSMVEAIRSQYGGLDSKEAKEALFSMKKVDAGEVFRTLLYKKGKLKQIEKSKRSGAANNAKDWVRELLLLDTDTGLKSWILQQERADGNLPSDGGAGGLDTDESKKKLINENAKNIDKQKKPESEEEKANTKKMLEELKEQAKREADVVLTPDLKPVSAYGADDIASFSNTIEDLWNDIRMDADNDDDEYARFFEASYDFIVNNIGEDSYVARNYEKYYQDHSSGDSYDLREYLIGLLESLLNQ